MPSWVGFTGMTSQNRVNLKAYRNHGYKVVGKSKPTIHHHCHAILINCWKFFFNS
ncbi:hypothetical protein Hanom_Chr14g01246851 [Helianthus anomalus]